MSRMHPLLSTLAVASLASAPGANAQTADLGVSDRNGVCGVELPTPEGPKLEISVRANNGNVNVALHDIAGEVVNAGLEAGTEPRVTLAFDDGQSFTGDLGAWRAGFTYRVLGAWSDPAAGRPVLAALRTARSVTVSFEGHSYGPIPTQQPGLAWNLLKGCVERNGGTMQG